DVALHAFYLRVVVGYRAVRVHPEHFALVYVGPVLGVYLLLRWEKLCPDWHAVAAELVVALVAYRVVQLAVRAKSHPAGIVVVAARQACYQVNRVAYRLSFRVVRKSGYLCPEGFCLVFSSFSSFSAC